MTDGVIGLLSAALLSRQPIQLAQDTLLSQLQKQCGAVDVVMAKPTEGTYAFAYRDYTVQYQDAALPAQTLINTHTHTSTPESYEAALQQTWDWAEARSTVEACQHSVIITDFMAGGLLPPVRLSLFNKVIRAVLGIIPCEAIYWQHSQQFTTPTAYLNNPNPLFGALNVRMFNIANRAANEVVMDTMGLATFGLPDIQCHFIQLDPDKVAQLLYNIGTYLFEKGDVIADGHTVPGIDNNSRWQCQHEDSLVAPEREVLDLNPGNPYAAGNR